MVVDVQKEDFDNFTFFAAQMALVSIVTPFFGVYVKLGRNYDTLRTVQ